MDAPEWVIGVKDLQRRPDKTAFSGLGAERRAARNLDELLFSRDYPNVVYQTFSRHIDETTPYWQIGFIAPLMEEFCQKYCYRSYREVLNTPTSPIDLLESVTKPDRKIHNQMVNQAIRASVMRLPDMVTLAKQIIHGPLARNKNLSPEEQNELIFALNERLNPSPHYSNKRNETCSPWVPNELGFTSP